MDSQVWIQAQNLGFPPHPPGQQRLTASTSSLYIALYNIQKPYIQSIQAAMFILLCTAVLVEIFHTISTKKAEGPARSLLGVVGPLLCATQVHVGISQGPGVGAGTGQCTVEEGRACAAGRGWHGGAQIPQMSVGGGEPGSGVHPWGEGSCP